MQFGKWILALVLIAFSGSDARAAARDGFVMNLNTAYAPLDEIYKDVADAQVMGAGHFIIPVLLCQDDRTSVTIDWCPLVPERYETIGREIRARGATVAFMPFLMARDGTWRGFFEPSDFDQWGASYGARLDEIAAIAHTVGAAEFIAGTELNHIYVSNDSKLQKRLTQYWVATLKKHRENLGVPAFIVANWDQWNQIPFWKESAYIGLSSYYPLATSTKDDTSVGKLAERWAKHAEYLLGLSKKEKRPLYFAELGYPSVATAAAEPWNFASGAVKDLELQARLFEAFGRTWAREKQLARFTVWALGREAVPSESMGYTVLGKPSEAALSEVFRIRNSQ